MSSLVECISREDVSARRLSERIVPVAFVTFVLVFPRGHDPITHECGETIRIHDTTHTCLFRSPGSVGCNILVCEGYGTFLRLSAEPSAGREP